MGSARTPRRRPTAWRRTPRVRCRAPPPAPSAPCRTPHRRQSAPSSRPRTPIVRQTQGNPLAAGLIAFGVGWLVSSLLPASEKEKQLAQQAETAVREHKDTLLEPAKQAAQEIGEQLKPAAQEAVESVKATAQDAAADRQGRGPVRRRRTSRARPSSPRTKVQSQVRLLTIRRSAAPPSLRPAGISRRGAVLSERVRRSPGGVRTAPRALQAPAQEAEVLR